MKPKKKYRIKIVDSYGVEHYLPRGQYTRKGRQKDNTYIPLHDVDIGDEGKFTEELKDKINIELLLQKLPPRQRQVIERRMDKVPYRIIAKEMGITIQTAYFYKKIAKKKLITLIS